LGSEECKNDKKPQTLTENGLFLAEIMKVFRLWNIKIVTYMNIKVVHDNNEIGRFASDLIIEEINRKLNFLLCMAKGDTPRITYTKLVDEKDLYHSDLIPLIRLDEWGGVPLKINY
jgi:hypothetical protein